MKGKASWECQNSYAIKIILVANEFSEWAKMDEFTMLLETFGCLQPEADKHDGMNMNVSDCLCNAWLKRTSTHGCS